MIYSVNTLKDCKNEIEIGTYQKKLVCFEIKFLKT